ncbi:hypothetical protein HZS_7556 [Henneguya salminicola]|nr:hypothetical protein HZS_7556 [Henneguya salminicola]
MLVGLDCGFIINLKEFLQSSQDKGFDFINIPLFKKLVSDTTSTSDSLYKLISWEGADNIIPFKDWSTCINTKLTSWCFSENLDESDAIQLQNIMRMELEYACYLSVRSVSFDLNRHSHIPSIAHVLKDIHENGRLKMEVIVGINICPVANDFQPTSNVNELLDKFDALCIMCDYLQNITLSLQIDNDQTIGEGLMVRLLGHNISCIALQSSLFYPNNKGRNIQSYLNYSFHNTIYSLI